MIIAIDLRPLLSHKLSGVELYLDRLLRQIVILDTKDIIIFFVNSFSPLPSTIPLFYGPRIFTVRTKIPNKIFNLSTFLFRRPFLDKIIFKKTGFQPEVILLPDLRPIALRKGVGAISVVHDLTFEHYPQFFSLKSRLWYFLLNPRKLISKSDHIIAVSDSTKGDVVKTYELLPEKITVIHEAVDNDFGSRISEKSCEDVRKKYRLPQRYMLFLSTLEPRKNIERLLTAFQLYQQKHTTDLTLVIAGQWYPDIFHKISLLPVKNVVCIGFVDEQDKATLMSMAELFLYPSLWEGFGLPLLEAMKVGVPIITSSISSMPEVVQDAALLIDPYSPQEIADAMVQAQLPEVRHRLKMAMERRIHDFSWKKCAEKTLEVIASFISSLSSYNPSRK